MAESSAIPPTLLSAIQETSMPDIIQTSGLHPFSSSSDKTIAFLHSLLDTTARVAHSVTLHSTTAVNDSRTVSLLREQSTGQHLLHLSRIQVANTISAAQERRRSDTWRAFSAWSFAVGMQAFPEAAAGTLVLGGKVLVLDVALMPEPIVHASYAGSAEGRDSPTMDAFFSRLGYLMCLDELAAHEGNGGARWFSEVDVLAKELAKFTQAEAAFLAHPWSQAKIRASERAHALILNPTRLRDLRLFLSTFFYSVVTRWAFHIFILRHSASLFIFPLGPICLSSPPTSDIPFTHLYNCLSGDHPPIGVTRATLTLVPLSALPHPPPSSADPLLSGRPLFPLAPNAIGFSYDFPLPAGPGYWSRMLEIARAVQPQELSYPGTGPSLSFMTGSWVDTLLNSEGALSSERYMATYVSPTNMHPPLRLTLTAPDEPGFLLERVQVYNMQEAWAVLEIVREQCDGPEAEATEEELRALLSGTYTPLSIPVNVYVAPAAVVLTFPERPPIPGMVSISVVLNGPAGARVEVQGAMGADVQMATLEEAVRRGGALGLAGRVWAASQTAP
ncbi:hypothetical protein EDB85DRAFT_2296401 [Lactarius pseudohatsudake]|nr:hypothetical protein EDB85DRAFT_2296401 [Lactarius pseudohatsudake]